MTESRVGRCLSERYHSLFVQRRSAPFLGALTIDGQSDRGQWGLNDSPGSIDHVIRSGVGSAKDYVSPISSCGVPFDLGPRFDHAKTCLRGGTCAGRRSTKSPMILGRSVGKHQNAARLNIAPRNTAGVDVGINAHSTDCPRFSNWAFRRMSADTS